MTEDFDGDNVLKKISNYIYKMGCTFTEVFEKMVPMMLEIIMKEVFKDGIWDLDVSSILYDDFFMLEKPDIWEDDIKLSMCYKKLHPLTKKLLYEFYNKLTKNDELDANDLKLVE